MVMAKVSLLDGLQFRGLSEDGHTLVIDPGSDHGGRDEGPTPMETVLMALGACTGMDVISILRKKRQDVTRYEINLQGERAEDYPRVFTRITMEHVITGRNVSNQAVQRAVELSSEKYCSVFAMLRKTAQIDFSTRVEEAVDG